MIEADRMALKMRRILKENDALRRLHYRLKMLRARSQSDECKIINRLAVDAPRTFIEFGFHPMEFNCAELARNAAWSGLLIDGNARQVADARALLPERLRIVESFLTIDNLDLIRSAFTRLGVLSIDVDGNDYWMLKALIDIAPTVICVEYNSSFGLEPITVPYEPSFDRNAKHPRAWYHGASLTALAKLCAGYGYGLAAICESGTNAFFTRNGNLDPEKAWKPSSLRLKFSGVSHEHQWASLRDMPFIAI